jgi:hypothetical protein
MRLREEAQRTSEDADTRLQEREAQAERQRQRANRHRPVGEADRTTWMLIGVGLRIALDRIRIAVGLASRRSSSSGNRARGDTMHRFPALALATAAVGVAAIAPAARAAPISKSIQFQNSTGKVTCGIEIHALNKPATEVLCAARGIPAPKQKGVGDPGFVQLSVLGQPQVLRLSQDSFVAGKSVKLGRGRLWNQLGVTCHMALSTVMCFNGDNHGFVIGNGHYRSF